MVRYGEPRCALVRLMTDSRVSELMRQLCDYCYETFEHSVNVAYLTAEICLTPLWDDFRENIGIRRDEFNVDDLVLGALLHDIGKLDIPKKILDKPGKLTKRELEIIHQHPLLGYNRLTQLGGFSDLTLDVVLHHHEKIDGSGYPDGITNCDELVQLVAFCDMYDALTASRCYRESMTMLSAYRILRDEHLDPDLFLMLVSCDDR